MEKDILIVEDSQERMKHIKQYVIGYSYDLAETADSAIYYLKSFQYDYIFLDHDLAQKHYEKEVFGKGTGLEVANYIADNQLPTT